MTRRPLVDRLASLEEFLRREGRDRAADDVRQAKNALARVSRPPAAARVADQESSHKKV